MERARSFGSVAEAYHRHRPGYPVELVDRVRAHAEGPVDRALEVGAGTGKATAVFAAAGLQVLATEPDDAMRAVLAREAEEHAWSVEVRGASFEDLEPGVEGPFDLVYAAAAFHWTDPATRWDRAAGLLRPGGALAVFGCARDLADPDVRAKVDALTEGRIAGGHRAAVPGSWTIEEVAAHPLLDAAEETLIEQRRTMAADDYVAHLGTVSAYLVLPPAERDALLAAVRWALPDPVEVSEDVPLHLARRA